ncbi:NACHT domain-containing protein [Streptomyces qinzhouensis]|uniref:NACHT domain-containing protein n=1 Tax=Streptomyces qinzhouensis TaxID=2599401 RepID=A0A5B8JID8_9ACTN|nr:NACHT domain-containing protein [Streptomyces qinzhouensis]QDY77283.1 NACHT domain-containing protein [Streptomyces qinzhouensis]
MDASAVTVRIASSAIAPLVKKLFVPGTAGAGLTDRPVRIAKLVSFRGEEQSTLGETHLRALAVELVARAGEERGPHEAVPVFVRHQLTEALVIALHSLGDLDMEDVQAVALGPEALAARLTRPRAMAVETEAYFDPLLETACLHILNFFSTRSTFVPRTLVEQTRAIDRLIAATDLLLDRIPSRLAEDTRFEQRYADHIRHKYGELTIYGLDLNHAREWPLDAAYVSLEATTAGPGDIPVPLPAERALSGRDRVLLRGPAGSGKTTLVQWLATATARQDFDELGGRLSHLVGRVPFVLPLRRVMRDGEPPTPDTFLHAVRSTVAGAQPTGWADRVLRAGRALLLVDGMDEIPRYEREATRRWMRELMAEFPGNLWLVTTRPSSVGEGWLTGERFTELNLSAMQRTEVERFVRRWHTAAHADDGLGDALIDAIHTNDDLGRLAVNPLMCGLLCALHRERRGFLPQGRKELYEAALRMLLERRDVERGVVTENELRFSTDTSIALLQKLAHWMIRNNRLEMAHEDALAQLKRTLGSMGHVQETPERVLSHLIERSGLLREPAAGRLDFVHRTFQDYLAAKALVEEGDFPLLLDNALNDQWEDVVRMAVALGRPAERKRVIKGLLGYVGGERGLGSRTVRSLLLAASCLDQAVEIDPDVSQRVKGLVSELLPPPSAPFARMLAEAGGPLVPRMLPGPEGLTHEQALNVVTTATHIGTDAALSVLVRYRGHASRRVRRQLVWSWDRFDTERYAREIIAQLDPEGLYFTAHNVDHLRALRAMGGRSRVQIAGPYLPHDLTENLDPGLLTHLWLREGYLHSERRWLDAFPGLRTLVIPEGDYLLPTALPPHLTVMFGRSTDVTWSAPRPAGA